MAFSIDELKAQNTQIQALIDGLSSADPNQNTSALGDLGTDLKRSIENIPGILTSIGDIIPGALFNATPFDTVTEAIGEFTGFQPGRFAEEARAELSPARQESDARVQAATGFFDTFTETLANPRSLAGVVAEAVPTMLAGGAIGKGLQLAGAVAKGATAVGIGEGAVSAGSQFESLTAQDVDPRTAALAATATGVVVGAIGIGGATLAQQMKIFDPDLVVAGLAGASRKVAGPPAPRIAALAPPAPPAPKISKLAKFGGVAARVGKGALLEGVVEEAPQSAFETMIANIALGKDLLDGVGESVATGLLAGSALGGAFNLRGTQPRGDELGTVGPQQTVAEVKQAAETAGIDINSFDGLVTLQKLLRESGDPIENAKAAKQRAADTFSAFVDELKKVKGVGIAKIERLRVLANGVETKEDADKLLSTLPVKSVQNRIRSSEYYANLPSKAEVAPTAAPAPEIDAEVEKNPSVLPEKVEVLTPAQMKQKVSMLKEAGIQIETLPADTVADTGVRADTGTADDAEVDVESGFTNSELRGLAGLVNGVDISTKEKADIAARVKAAKDVKQRLKTLKAALPQFYTKTGAPRANIPADLKAFLALLPKIGEEYGGDGRVLAGIRVRAENLAAKYNVPKLTAQVQKLAYGYKLLTNAKAVIPLSREARLNLQRLGIKDDPQDEKNIATMFSALHDMIKNYDQKTASLRKSSAVTTDFTPRLKVSVQEEFDAAQQREADRAVSEVIGEDIKGSRNLFALGQEIAKAFADLEAKVGQDNLLKAMKVSKRAATKTRKALPGVKHGQESSTAIRFSQLYKQFRDNRGTIDPTPSRIPARLLIEEQSRREKAYTDSAGNQIPYTPVVIAGDGTITREARQPLSRIEEKLATERAHRAKSGKQAPVLLLLDTISQHSMNAVSGLLANRFKVVLEKSGYVDKIDLVLHPETLAPKGQAGSFRAARPGQNAVIELWGTGTRESTILHETLHAITVGVVSQWKNNAEAPTASQIEALEALEVMRADIVSALRGQEKNTGKPLEGRLGGIVRVLENSDLGLDEFLTYAMTDSDLQNWMRNHPAPTGAGLKVKNWWQVFTAKLKKMLSLQTVPNSQFNNILDSYLEATGTLIADVSQSAERGLDIFFFEPTATPEAEGLTALVETIITSGKGMGKARAARLRNMVTSNAGSTKQGIDAALKGLPKGIQEQIRATKQYQGAPEAPITTENRGERADTGTRANADIEAANRYHEYYARLAKRMQRDAAGQEALDELIDTERSPRDVSTTFWDSTYSKLPQASKQLVERYIERLTGWTPGAAIASLPDGQVEIGGTWEALGRALGDDFPLLAEGLEGTERGYVVMLEAANRGVNNAPVLPRRALRDTGVRADTVDPSKPWTGTFSTVEATAAAKVDADNRAKHRATIKNAEAEEAAAAEATESVPPQSEASKAQAKKERTTAVRNLGVGQRIGPRNATFIDKIERTIADGVITFLSAGKYTNYEAFANAMLSKYGNIIEDYSAQDSFIAQGLGRFLSKTVDGFGLPSAYRNGMASFESAFRGTFNEAYSTYEALTTLTAEQQQSLLDFLFFGDEAALRANIPNEKQHETIVRTYKALNDILQRAKDLGMVAKKDMHKSVGDFISLKEGRFGTVRSASFNQFKAPEGKNNNVAFSGTGDGEVSYVPKNNVIGKDGTPIASAIGKQFYMGNSRDNGFYAIEVGADIAVWNDFGVAPLEGANADPRPFLVSNPTTANEDFTMYRKVTVAERHKAAREKLGESLFDNSARARAHVMSGMTKLVQEWGRNVQGRELVDNMVTTNNNIENEQDKWITDILPTKTDGTKMDGRRIVEITDTGEAQKSHALRARLRVPGNWAHLEDNAENRKLFGAMAGKYVAGPVYSSMLDYYDTTPVINLAAFRTSLSLWKKGKTIFAPIAHVNNISSNVVLAYYYDLPAENIVTAYKVVVWGLHSEGWQKRHPLSKQDAALLSEMNDKGITLAQAKSADFDVAAEIDFSNWVEGFSGSSPSLVNVFHHIEKASAKASDLYSNQDNIFRLATYMTYIQDNATIGPDGAVSEAIKNAAALQAEKAFVDYRIHAPWIKNARESVLPFVAWPYRMFPLLMKVLITKPWKAANTMGAIYGLNALAYSLLGTDGDEEEVERNLMPEWYQQGIAWMPNVPSSIRLPFGDENNAYFWNISRAVTLADMDQLGGSGVPSIIMPGGPAAILMYAMAGFDPFTGKELSNGTEDLSGFLESRAEYLFRGLAPGFATSIRTAVKRQGETGPLGYDHSFWVDAAKLLGISSFQLNKPEAAFYKDITRKQMQREFSAEIGRTWRNELRQKSPDFDSAVADEIKLQRRLTLRLQKLAGG